MRTGFRVAIYVVGHIVAWCHSPALLAEDIGAAKSVEEGVVVERTMKSVAVAFDGVPYEARLVQKIRLRPGARSQGMQDWRWYPDVALRAHSFGIEPTVSGVELLLTPWGEALGAATVAWRQWCWGAWHGGHPSIHLYDMTPSDNGDRVYLLMCHSFGASQAYYLYVITKAAPSPASECRYLPDPLGGSELAPTYVLAGTDKPATPPQHEVILSRFQRGWEDLDVGPNSVSIIMDGDILRIEGHMRPLDMKSVPLPFETDVPILVTYNVKSGEWQDVSDEHHHYRGTRRRMEIRLSVNWSISPREPPPFGRYRERRYTDEVPGAPPLPPEMEQEVNEWKRKERAKDRALFLAADQERAAARAKFLAAWPEYEAMQALPEPEKSAARRPFLEKWFPDELAKYKNEFVEDLQAAEAAWRKKQIEEDPIPPETEEGNAVPPTTPTDPSERWNPAHVSTPRNRSLDDGKREWGFPWLLAAGLILVLASLAILLLRRFSRGGVAGEPRGPPSPPGAVS